MVIVVKHELLYKTGQFQDTRAKVRLLPKMYRHASNTIRQYMVGTHAQLLYRKETRQCAHAVQESD